MKIRLGFVSNSSTTSFCIYGCCLEESEALAMLSKTGIITKEQEEYSEPWEILDEMAEENKIECHSGQDYDDSVWFGFSLTAIPDDVNVGEWKKEKTEMLKKFFGDDVKCGIYLEAWRDG